VRPELVVGEESRSSANLAVLGAGLLILGLAVAVSGSPALGLRLEEIAAAVLV